MRILRTVFSSLVVLLSFLFCIRTTPPSGGIVGSAADRSRSAQGMDPELDNDWFMTQRSFPQDQISVDQFDRMKSSLLKFEQQQQSRPLTTASLQWNLVGPSNIGGRVTAVVIHPTNPDIIYIGAASGGVWKTLDRGTTWANIFNEAYSIGALLLDPTNPNTLYVGTGEANPSGVATYPGNGLWRSTNAGATWGRLGLDSTGYIGKIAIHPSSPRTIFVAVLGYYRNKTQERGIYRSTDGGSAWSRVLFVNDTTGACDVVIDPLDTNRVFAALWTRYRTPHVSILSGPSGGLFLSTDKGTSWSAVTTGFPTGSSTLGRISLAHAPSNPSVMYAVAAAGVGWGGLYRSTDRGITWTKTFDGGSTGESQVWYNNLVTVDPGNANNLWVGMTNLYRSINGGSTIPPASISGDFHVDQHALTYAPSDPNTIVLGNDGGIFISADGGNSWTKSYDLPITQFYAGTVSTLDSSYILGGTQDNNSVRSTPGFPGPWSYMYCCDGFYVLLDPTNELNVYAESQNGGLAYSTDGGAGFFDGTAGIDPADRKNWEVPFAMDPQNPKKLYTGTQRLYRTLNGMHSWTALTGDLTYGNGGRVGTITTIDVARTDSSVVYVGTDDGRVWVTTDGGALWQDIAAGLPQRWVTRVTADPHSPSVAYVTLSGFIENEYAGHIYRTTNAGANWTNIGGSLPDVPLNDVVVDPANPSHLFIASDQGVLSTDNLGASWNTFGTGLPPVAVHDLTFQTASRTLVAFTHGRSAFSIQIPAASPLTLTVPLLPNWNLVSNPLNGFSDSVHALFPAAITGGFAFFPDSGYKVRNAFVPGRGYWLKFPSTPNQTQAITGYPATAETVHVNAGWNIIGSLPTAISVGQIATVGTSLQSMFYGYTGGYQVADSIKPGRGCWVKVSQAGDLVLASSASPTAASMASPSSAFARMKSLTFTDAAGNSGRLYVASADDRADLANTEMPPVPPARIFDVRFAHDRLVETNHSDPSQTTPILILTDAYPITIRWESMPDGSILRAGEKSIPLATAGSYVMNDPSARVSLASGGTGHLPGQFVLHQNYPNPFNPSTVIRYDLPGTGHVRLSMFNVAGQMVRTVVPGEQEGGAHEIMWDGVDEAGQGVASGIYWCRLEFRPAGEGREVSSETRKMLLVR